MIASNEVDFFRDFELHHGDQLPTISVTHGNEWELYSASMAETSARVRRSVEKLRPAELAATLVSLKEPAFLQDREPARDLAFTNLGLYWEHDWTADGPVARPVRAAWQERLAAEIEAYVDSLHSDAAERLGSLIQRAEGKGQRFYVLNPLSWARTDYADFAYTGSTDIHVQDLSSESDVPHQFVYLAGSRFLRVLASDVPSTGYKVFEILEGPGVAPTSAAATVGARNTTLENSLVRIGVDADGAIASLIDKAHSHRELAAAIDGLKLNDLAANETGSNPVAVENAGPVSVTLKCTSDAGLQRTTHITLLRDADRVEIHNEIAENFADVRHWAFSFNLNSPDVHAEEVGAVIRVKTQSAGGDYADTHARFDYATLNHFVDMANGANTAGVTLANADCAFFRLGHSTPTMLDTTTPQIHVLAGGQVDGPKLGIRRQNGQKHFVQRFAIRPHSAYDPVTAMKFALESQNRFVTAAVTGTASSAYPAKRYSLLTLSDPSVLLWALKPHEESIANGVVVRAWNLSNAASDCLLSLTPGVTSANLVTHIETDRESLHLEQHRVVLRFNPTHLQTLRLIAGP